MSGVDITGLPEGEYVHITFEDNGCGMSDEVRRRAFDPLFTTKVKGGRRGQGLGLAMVFNIITGRYGGNIDIESEEGKGTAFHIYLPKGQPEEEVKVFDSIRGGDETVLIIEDEEPVSRLAESLLKRFGYKVLTASDGEEGLDMYTKTRKAIDLVLLDLTMPRMSGRIVFKRMLSINPDVKVIICSGQSKRPPAKQVAFPKPKVF
ncbi:Sensor kinase CckA [subsurface metagenome]